MGDSLHKAIAVRLCNQVVNGKPTADNIHEKFVEFCCDLKQACIVGLTKRLQFIARLINHHLLLFFVEKEPNAHDSFQMLLTHPIKVRLGAFQLLFALFFEHLEVKAEEALHARRVFQLQILHVRVQCVQRLDQPLVHLGPSDWEVILDEDGDHEGQLLIAALGQDNILRVVDHLEQLRLNLRLKLVRQWPLSLISCTGCKSDLLGRACDQLRLGLLLLLLGGTTGCKRAAPVLLQQASQ